MSTTRHHIFWLILACGTVFFFQLGAARLFDEDEPKNAECGREMLERGDWLVPTYNYDLRTDKPIMLYWLMLSSFHAWGVSEFSARLPSAVMASLTVLYVYGIGRRLFDAKTGFWSAMILASSLMYATIGRISTPDATLIGFIVLSFFVFVFSLPVGLHGWGSANNGQIQLLPTAWWQFVLMYAVMGMAVLTKGPVGFLLPCAVIGLFVMCLQRPLTLPQKKPQQHWIEFGNDVVEFLAAFWAPSRFFRALWSMRPFTLLGVVVAVACPWYVAVSWVTEGAWLTGFLGNHNVGRFTSAMEGHRGPFFYYVIAILLGFFPWSVFLPISLYTAVKRQSRFAKESLAVIFLLCWAGVYIGFFSLAQTKLPNYVLPSYPALSLLVGWTLVRWQEQKLELPNWALLWGPRTLILAGAGLAVAFPVLAATILPGAALWGVIGIVPIVAGSLLLGLSYQSQRLRFFPIMAGTSVLFVVVILAGVAPWISRNQESVQLGILTAQQSANEIPVATYRYFTTNLPFYAQRQIFRYHSADEIQKFLNDHPAGILCVRATDWKNLQTEISAPVQVVSRHSRFLRGDEVLMLRGTGRLAETKTGEKTIR